MLYVMQGSPCLYLQKSQRMEKGGFEPKAEEWQLFILPMKYV
jgi:hypothetical protein